MKLILHEGSQLIGDNPVTVPLHPPETLNLPPWQRTRTSAATDRLSYGKNISWNLSQYWQDLSHSLLCFPVIFCFDSIQTFMLLERNFQ